MGIRDLFSQTHDMGPQIHECKEQMLRGYDPLSEMYYWRLIMHLLAGEMALVGIASAPPINNIGFMDGEATSLTFELLFLLIYTLLIIGMFLFLCLSHRREKRRRDVLRRVVLKGKNSALAPTQPSSSQILSLPCRLESSVAKKFSVLTVGVIILLAVFVAINNVLILDGFWRIPVFFSIIPYAFAMILPTLMLTLVGWLNSI